ncbi:MAG: 50S ribosomal protein L17 [Porphyromonadaceae bacterium]|nr:MAG: 50S ribosomal protein L17 [Porphyromonadaceae bacterium]
MRHGDKQNNLGRKSAHREAMLGNMACALIKHKRISTTVAKAKALRKYVEPLITKAKDDTTHSRRIIFSYLSDKEAVTELFRDVTQKISDRPGGYTRILKTGTRLGDSAEMCIIELVDFNENMLSAKADVKAKTTRRSRKSPKTAADEATTTVEKKPAAKTAKKKVEGAEKAKTKAKTEEVIEPVTEEEVSEDLQKEKE